MDLARLLRHLLLPRWQVNRVLPAAALARIEQEIARSESCHGGQIRFAVEHALDVAQLFRGLSARDRAVDVFSTLRVWDTEHNNGVLVYLLLADRNVEIVADRGVHALAGEQGWESVCRAMEAAFRAGRFEDGVVEGIRSVSRVLEANFPPGDARSNELPDRPVVL